jgi:hypothetical protein
MRCGVNLATRFCWLPKFRGNMPSAREMRGVKHIRQLDLDRFVMCRDFDALGAKVRREFVCDPRDRERTSADFVDSTACESVIMNEELERCPKKTTCKTDTPLQFTSQTTSGNAMNGHCY